MTDKILWADDEIDLLKPHILFLKAKGYEVTTVSNGRDALDALENEPYSLILLDENMPGISGLETLALINRSHPDIPVIMITKSEEENIMDQAIGNQIADYLIKPVNPNQILLSIKKNLHSREIVATRASSEYQQDFMRISSLINTAASIQDWMDVYRELVRWELKLAETDNSMSEMLLMQKRDANSNFCKFVKRNYEDWVTGSEHPLMSHEIFRQRVSLCSTRGRRHVSYLLIISDSTSGKWCCRLCRNSSMCRKNCIPPFFRPPRSMRETPYSQVSCRCR